MAAVYNLEPPTSGKVVLTTNYGEVDVELDAEAPLACRNFIQLGIEGYYDAPLPPHHQEVHGAGRRPHGRGRRRGVRVGQAVQGRDPLAAQVQPPRAGRWPTPTSPT